MSIAKAFLLGRLTADPEYKQTPNGVSVATFSVAVDRKSANGEKIASFIPCVAWRSTADFVSRYFTKGQEIGVVGSLQQRSYEDRSGQKRNIIEVIVNEVSFAGSKSESSPAPKQKQTSHNSGLGDFGDFEDIDPASEDDLPF